MKKFPPLVVLVFSLLMEPALAVEGEGGLVIEPGTEVTFGIGNPNADFNLPTKEIIGYPQPADWVQLYNGTYKELLCTVGWDPSASEFAAFTSNVAQVPAFGAALVAPLSQGCDCFARAHAACWEIQGWGGCLGSTFVATDIGGLTTCSCVCSAGARRMLAACISGSDGIGTYKNLEGDLVSVP